MVCQHRLRLDAALIPVLLQAAAGSSHTPRPCLSMPSKRESVQWLDPAGKPPIRKNKPEIIIPLGQPAGRAAVMGKGTRLEETRGGEDVPPKASLRLWRIKGRASPSFPRHAVELRVCACVFPPPT